MGEEKEGEGGQGGEKGMRRDLVFGKLCSGILWHFWGIDIIDEVRILVIFLHYSAKSLLMLCSEVSRVPFKTRPTKADLTHPTIFSSHQAPWH